MTVMPAPKLVIVESPYRATAERSVEQHRLYLQHAMADCYRRGEAPFASHHLSTEVLNDDDVFERALGIRCGLAWGDKADLVAVYSDLGVSPGMKQAVDQYKAIGKPIEWRSLDHKLVLSILNA
jgi:hypothetical protein